MKPSLEALLIFLGECSGFLLEREELLSEEEFFLEESQEIDIFLVTYMSTLNIKYCTCFWQFMVSIS